MTSDNSTFSISWGGGKFRNGWTEQPVCEIGKYFWGGHWLSLMRGGAHARGSSGPDSGPTPVPFSLCQDDINLIVTCFNAVIKIV